MKRAAVTIGELLVVLVTIGVLALILRPNICGDSGKARQITCASNEKQLGLAIQNYALDNDDNLPNIAAAADKNLTWRSAIFPYARAKPLYLCPSRRDKDFSPDGFYRSYAANYNGDYRGGKKDQGNGAFADAGSKPINREDIPHPDQLIMLCEFAGGNTPEFNIDDPVRFGPGKKLLWAGHDGGSDYLLADGHVKYMRPQTTKDFWHRDSSVPLSVNAIKVLAETAKRAGR